MKKSIALSVFGAFSLPLLITGVGANAATFIDNAPNKAGIVVTDVHAKAGESFNLSILDSDMEAKGYTVESVHYSVKQVDGTNDTGLETTLSEDKKVIAVKVNPDESDKVSYRIQAGVSLAKHGTAECTDTGCISDVSRVQLPKQFMVKVRSLDNGASSEVKTDQDGGASSDIKINLDPEVVVDEPETPTSTPVIAAKPQVVESSKATPTDIKVESTEVKVNSEKATKQVEAPVSRSKAIKVVKPTDTAPKPVIVSEESTAPVSKVKKAVATKVEVEPLVVAKRVSDDAPKATVSRLVEYTPATPVSPRNESTVLPATSVSTLDDDAVIATDSKESKVSDDAKWNQVDNKGSVIGSVPDGAVESTHERKVHKSIGSVPSNEGSSKRDRVNSSPSNQEVYESSERATQAFNKLLVPAWVFAGSVAALAIGFLTMGAVKLMKRNKA